MSASTKPVALVSMPSLSARFPSFQLALLKPTLEAAGIPAQCFSLFMYFGTHVGWGIAEAISEVYSCMAGEWIWSKAAFGEAAIGRRRAAYFDLYEPDFEVICRRAGCTRGGPVGNQGENAPGVFDFFVRENDLGP